MNGLYVLRPMRGEVFGHLEVNNAFALDTGEGAAKEAAWWHFSLAHLGAEAVHGLSLEDNDIPSIQKVPRCGFCFFLSFFFLILCVICFRYKKPYAAQAMKRKKPISHNNHPLHLLIGKIKHTETIEKAPLA